MSIRVVFAGLLALAACKHAAAPEVIGPGSGSGGSQPPAVSTPDGAASPPPSTPPAEPPADAATDDVPFGKSDECVAIVTKIKECQHDAAFAKALDKGGDAKANAKLRKQVSEWPQPWPTCDTYFELAFEHVGFLKDPDVLIDDHVLDTCATLGSAIREAGGLPGGDVAM